MTRAGLSNPVRLVLEAIGAGASQRKTVFEHCRESLSRQQVDRAMARLDAMGLCDKPAQFGKDWQLTRQGRILLGLPASEPALGADETDSTDSDEPELPAELPAEMSAEMSAELPASDANFDPTAWEPEPDSAPPPCVSSDQIAADLLAAMEIEVALDHVRTKLRSAAIPAQAQRVYREILNVLPPTLVDALDPITLLVAAHNLQ